MGCNRLNTSVTGSASSLSNLELATNKIACSTFSSNFPISVNVVVSKDIRHRRLGHPS